MARIPNQYEDDRLLRDCLKHGELLKLSTALRIPYGTFTRQVNPDDHQLASPYHVAKNFFFQLFQMRAGACLAMKADLDAAVESWVEAKSSSKDASHLVGDVANEVAELVCCRLNGRPAHIQRKEAADVIAAVQAFMAGLDNENRLRGLK